MDALNSTCDVLANMLNCKHSEDGSKESCKVMYNKEIVKCKKREEERMATKRIGEWQGCQAFANQMTVAISSDFNYPGGEYIRSFLPNRIYHIPSDWLKLCEKYMKLTVKTRNADGTERNVYCRKLNENTLFCDTNITSMIERAVPGYYYDGKDAAEMIKENLKYNEDKKKENPYWGHYIIEKKW